MLDGTKLPLPGLPGTKIRTQVSILGSEVRRGVGVGLVPTLAPTRAYPSAYPKQPDKTPQTTGRKYFFAKKEKKLAQHTN